MPPNSFELKITRDATANVVELDNMSIEASRAFVALLDSMNKIIACYNIQDHVSVKLVKGSAAIQLEAPEIYIEAMENDLEDILTFRSDNSELVDLWRNVQKVIKRQDLEFEARFSYSNKLTSIDSIIPRLRDGVRLRIRRPEFVYTGVKFLTGQLIEVGGKNPNLHILNQFGDKIKISCTQKNAISAQQFLYKQLHISVFCREREPNEKDFFFCDVYNDKFNMDLYHDFYVRAMTGNTIVEQLMNIHIIGREVIESDLSLSKMRKFMRMFNNNQVDSRFMKSIMILTKAFKDHENLKRVRSYIVDKYNQRNRL